ncbi:assimilatory sulfite reductase (NADPH) flavoprotein subunit [Glaciecola siphonariae]|uniref:Sulfite reductase [NADPH] flavoprotein alpha-component n=1 Tax=Glaciecola siphonariae TaxID=521012 RepID=A0ABV9M1B7_9ALTE
MSSNQDNTPFPLINDAQLSQISAAVSGLNKEQLIWASGYLAGLSQGSTALASVPAQAAPANILTVLFGSQTGNSKHAAMAYAESAKAKGYTTNVVSMSDYKPRKIKDETHLVVFVSTHGEGDAPDDAVELHEFLASKKAPKLDKLKYAVVGLGDTSYEFFCQTGKDFDARLKALGATPLIDRLDCDVEFEAEFAAWTEKLNAILADTLTPSAAVIAPSAVAKAVATATYTKQNPFTATLSESIKITGRDSVKDIRHIEISLEDSGIQYQVGDALGVYFLNSPDVVSRIIQASQNKPDDSVTISEQTYSLEQALKEKLELTLSYPGFVKAYQAASKNEALLAVLDDKTALRAFLDERQIVDIVEQFPADIAAQDLVDALRPLSPRLYSIASSQSEVEDEVHLTVAHIDYEAFGFRHQGGASGYLCTHLEQGGEIKVYVENNDNFRLPQDPNVPVIMVGPGTGIAPFRAFMQERDAQGAEGKNWLFFGNPNFTQDFLYQTEWQAYLKSGLLSKISLAFSRDQANKIYVQDRMLEQGEQLYKWLESGAHFYVCGDAMRMAKDVEAALLTIIEKHGKKSAQEAKQFLLEMRKAKRYQKDVY